MQARDIMQKDVVTLSPLMTLREAGKELANRGITGAPVVDRRGGLMGVVSQTDIVRCGASHDKAGIPCFYSETESAASFGQAPERSEFDTMTVLDVMTKNPVTAEEGASVEELIALMLKRGVHRVLITRETRLCGIVTTMDILRVLPGARLRS